MWGVTCCVRKISMMCCIEKIFSWWKKSCFIFSLTLVIGMLYDMKIKCDCIKIFFFHARNHTLTFFHKIGYISCLCDTANRYNRKCTTEVTVNIESYLIIDIIFFCFIIGYGNIQCMMTSLQQQKIIFKPRIKANHYIFLKIVIVYYKGYLQYG